MKTLNHPNLVKMLGVCIEKSPFYLVQVSARMIFCSDDDFDDNDYNGDDSLKVNLFQELCSNGDLRNHLKSFDFVKTITQVGQAYAIFNWTFRRK